MLGGGVVPDGDGVEVPPPAGVPVEPPPAGLLKEKIGESGIFLSFYIIIVLRQSVCLTLYL